MNQTVVSDVFAPSEQMTSEPRMTRQLVMVLCFVLVVWVQYGGEYLLIVQLHYKFCLPLLKMVQCCVMVSVVTGQCLWQLDGGKHQGSWLGTE